MGRRRRGRRRCGILDPMIPMGMEKEICGDSDDHLPLLRLSKEVLIKILVCLPVKSLLAFKSICKSWRQLIKSSFFIDLHASFNSSSKFGAFIIQTTEPASNKYKANVKLFKLSSSNIGDGTTGGEDDEDDNDGEEDYDKKKKKMVFKVDDLGFLSFYEKNMLHDTLRMVGSCNGIICLHDPEVMEVQRGIYKKHYSNLMDGCLWNPATRQFRILPKSIPIEKKTIHYSGRLVNDFIAFGFDVETKDYKVLRINPREEMCLVQVYSLSTDSWRLLEGINSLPDGQVRYENHGIYLNGSYFFVGRKSDVGGSRDEFMLLSFDFTKEIFNTIQLPENNIRYNHLVLSSLGGKLALFDGYYRYFDIWVLNEQQDGNGLGGILNKESSSWTKLHSNLSFEMKSIRKEVGNPRCISNNGEFALISTWPWEENNKLQLFNLVTKEAAKKDLTIGSWGTKVYRADVYKESLVSIMGGNVLLS